MTYQGSMIITCDAAVKFKATPPAFNDIRNTVISGSFVNYSMTTSRCSLFMLPSSFTQLIPVYSNLNYARSSIDVYCENTMALALGSSFFMFTTSSHSASSFVELLNCLRSGIRLIILLLLNLVLVPRTPLLFG